MITSQHVNLFDSTSSIYMVSLYPVKGSNCSLSTILYLMVEWWEYQTQLWQGLIDDGCQAETGWPVATHHQSTVSVLYLSHRSCISYVVFTIDQI